MIIGNTTWTDLQCDECEQDHLDSVLKLGALPDSESRTVTLCASCLQKAAKLLGSQA